MTTTTQTQAIIPQKSDSESYLGTCPACMGAFKLEPKGLTMVLHGYQRPGWGHTVGSCFGVGYQSWELSPKGGEDLLVRLERQLANLNSTLAEAVEDRRDEYNNTPYSRTCTPVRRDEPGFRWARENFISRITSERDSLARSVESLRSRIAAWQPGELRVAEKVEAIEAAERAARKAAKDAERAARKAKQEVTRKLTNLRGTIDDAIYYAQSAARKGDADTEARHRETARQAALELAQLTGKDAEKILKRYVKKHTW